MTNEEAKEKLYLEWQKFLEDNIDYAGISEAYKTAFKALDQEPILNKIREEIEFERDRKLGGKAFEAVQYKSFNKCLQIIDKYRQEG